MGEQEHPMFRVEADGRIEQVRCENCESLSAQLVEAREALPDPAKLLLLADWLDKHDAERGVERDEVQRDLRAWADKITLLLVRLSSATEDL